MPSRLIQPLKLLRGRFDRSTFYKSVALIAGGTALAQIITLLSSPVVTRLYTPADFGVLGIFVAILGVMQPLSTLTYALAIPLAEDTDESLDLLRVSLLIAACMSILLALVLLAFGDVVTAHFAVPAAAPYLWLLPVCLLGSGLYEALSAWALRRKYFKVVARTKLSQGISSAFIRIALGVLGFQPLGLLLGLLATSMAGCGSIGGKLLQEERQFLRRWSWKHIRVAANRYARFPLYRSWSKFLLGLNARLPVFFIAASFGADVVGLFTLAYSMISLPMNLAGGAFAQVYYAEIAGYGKANPQKIRKLSLSLMKRIALMGLVPTAALMLAGPWLFTLVFGEQWRDAGVFAQFLALITWGQFVAAPIMSAFDVFEMQSVQLAVNLFRLALTAGVFLVTQFLEFSPLQTIGTYSVVVGLYLLFLIGLVIRTLNKHALCKPVGPEAVSP